eukprot:scaffold25842_cov198-Amphora_coffeaeformis.AAC.7
MPAAKQLRQPFLTPVISQDDECSIHSTFAAERSSKKVSSSRVSFHLTQNEEFTSPDFYEEDVSDRWYLSADFKQFKKDYVQLAKQFQSHDRKQSDDPLSFKAMLLKAFRTCCDTRSEDPRDHLLSVRNNERALQKWLSKGSRRGMERISVLAIFADKSARRKKVTDAVLQAQASCQDAELIRQVSMEITRPSRIFAWRLAL